MDKLFMNKFRDPEIFGGILKCDWNSILIG